MIKGKYSYTIHIRYFRISYVPASYAPVVRVFSRAGRNISPLRLRLSPRHLGLLTLIACNNLLIIKLDRFYLKKFWSLIINNYFKYYYCYCNIINKNKYFKYYCN